jgi:hypothetical protein
MAKCLVVRQTRQWVGLASETLARGGTKRDASSSGETFDASSGVDVC